jgi:ABC-2 type transport system permease protein
MRELLKAAGILFRVHLLRTVRTKRGLIALLLAALPAGLALIVGQIVRAEGPAPREVFFTILWLFGVQTVVPLVSLVMSSGVIAEEIEDRTITYLFTRPMPRAAILLGRWLAVALPIVLLLCVSTALAVAFLADVPSEDGEWLPAGFGTRLLWTVAMGGAVYSALFAAAGTIFKRPMLVGLGYTFVFESFLGNLPGSNQRATVLYYLKSFAIAGDPELTGELHEVMFAVPLLAPEKAVLALALILIGILGLASWRLARREYVLAA